MKVHAPEGYTGTMKRVDSVPGFAAWEVKAKRNGSAFKSVGRITLPIGTPYRGKGGIFDHAESLVLGSIALGEVKK